MMVYMMSISASVMHCIYELGVVKDNCLILSQTVFGDHIIIIFYTVIFVNPKNVHFKRFQTSLGKIKILQFF